MPARSLARLTLLSAAGCLIAAASPPPRNPAGDPPGLSVRLEETPFGCRVSAKATNGGGYRLAISRDSQVKSGAGQILGVWRKLGKSVWVNPHGSAQWTYDLAFGCNMNRTYRFQVKKFDANDKQLGDYWYYFPSTTGVSHETAFSLGDLNRFF